MPRNESSDRYCVQNYKVHEDSYIEKDFLQNYARKWGTVLVTPVFILVGCQEEMLWLMFTTCEKE
jgi:hypothetical protein